MPAASDVAVVATTAAAVTEGSAARRGFGALHEASSITVLERMLNSCGCAVLAVADAVELENADEVKVSGVNDSGGIALGATAAVRGTALFGTTEWTAGGVVARGVVVGCAGA